MSCVNVLRSDRNWLRKKKKKVLLTVGNKGGQFSRVNSKEKENSVNNECLCCSQFLWEIKRNVRVIGRGKKKLSLAQHTLEIGRGRVGKLRVKRKSKISRSEIHRARLCGFRVKVRFKGFRLFCGWNVGGLRVPVTGLVSFWNNFSKSSQP